MTVVAGEGRHVEPASRAGQLSEAEFARARAAYGHSLEAARAWRAFSPDTRHHDLVFWTLLTSLFTEPGLNRTTLIERIIAYAGVSRSTAERSIREARASGYLVPCEKGREVRFFLSPRLNEHCVAYFRAWLDQRPAAPAS